MQPLSRSYSIKQQKEIDSHRIADQVTEFLRAGGRINNIPQGLSGDKALNENSKLALMNNQGREDRKRGLVGGAAVARMAGMSHAKFLNLCLDGKGPPDVQDGKRRMYEKAVVAEWLDTLKSGKSTAEE